MVLLAAPRRTSDVGLRLGLEEERRQTTRLRHDGSSAEHHPGLRHQAGEEQQMESGQRQQSGPLRNSLFSFLFAVFVFLLLLEDDEEEAQLLIVLIAPRFLSANLDFGLLLLFTIVVLR